MNEKQFKEFKSWMDKELRDYAIQINSSTKKEQSGLYSELKVKLDYIEKAVDELRVTVRSGYIKREEFEPIKKIVYGVVSLILMGVVGALLALVIQK